MQIGNSTRAIVTGASKGIGRSVALELSRRGATVGLLSRGKKGLDEAAAELPGRAVVLPADVTDIKELERAVSEFVESTGGLDLLVANAGIAHYGPFEDLSQAQLDEMVSINVSGSIYTVKAALPAIENTPGPGHIVITSSGAGLRAFPEAAVYGATKAANRGFGEAMRHELAAKGIGVTTVYPGEFETELHAHELELLPDWRNNDEQMDPAELAVAICEAIEADARSVHMPALVKLLGLNGIAPGLVDRLLRRIRGESAAPRR